MSLKEIRQKLESKEAKWYFSIFASFIITILYAIYNGFLGVYKHSIWNGSICVYFIFLVAIRFVILVSEKKINHYQNDDLKLTKRKRVFFILSIIIFVMNLSMIAPISLMVLNQRQVSFGLVPAIVIASYTTYKVTMAIINYTKYRKYENLAYRQMRTINIIDAILSILTLQNALILVNEGNMSKSMFILTSITSFVAILFIVTISIVSIIRFLKENKS